MAKVTKAKLDKAWLGDVPGDRKNMAELSAALKEMPNDIFEYHLNSERNDFSSWVRDVIGDMTLAGQLARVASQATALKRVEMRLSSIIDS